MAYPGEGLESYYRNSFDLVKNRSEKLYDLSKFEHAANYPFLDHQAPPFRTLIDFCKDTWEWLSTDERHVVVIHCKAGKGRTGTVIACLLLHLGEARDAVEAMAIYAEKRTRDRKGITIPSQKRYVGYYEYMLHHQALYHQHQSLQSTLNTLTLSSGTLSDFAIRIDCQDVCVHHALIKTTEDPISIHLEQKVWDDVKITFSNAKGKVWMSFWFNVVFVFLINKNQVLLRKQDLDLIYENKEFSHDFTVQLLFSN
ncbi:hypothetical protein G6F57_010089 [Rhizopus arrhizus]|uniref:Phosphatidylinositol 3,4,5-trisphosphate 3-phosphatase and dual-specificity protein phosphatase PTEN n=1 Tax=Rhizopus oryzae TaxID=64495 RepID=A0A9P6X2P5_RHIOR|nr:hypothetical protein G6F23_010953 [Rhizopus arrhizus]KAG1397645.1 hypothetical protein G6F58_011483 [Rhizopus delemar]KAG0759507.1 hypothetical protein G6F24_009012 [Rhizopus arrhizus]KAG0779161.1 hypothetical protein G6F22_010797 [Rhizopus arrhizus]KAG0788400.1 hypothetical protein G6F21_007242 [Rhizopus arrhizus]